MFLEESSFIVGDAIKVNLTNDVNSLVILVDKIFSKNESGIISRVLISGQVLFRKESSYVISN